MQLSTQILKLSCGSGGTLRGSDRARVLLRPLSPVVRRREVPGRRCGELLRGEN